MSSNGNKMSFKKSNLSLVNRHNGRFKIAAVFALLVSTVTFNLGFANETDKEEFSKIFHVYVAEAYIGSVADEASIQQIIEQKEQEANSQYKGFTIEAGSNITVIPEQVFIADTKEKDTLAKLQEAITVQAQAYSLQLGDTVIAILKDKEDFDAVLNGLKLQYVSQNELDMLTERDTSTNLPSLNTNETRLVDVKLSADVTGQDLLVNPAEIVTVQEAIALLQTGSIQTESYLVKPGDVLGSIASSHSLTTAQLLQINPDLTANSILQIGQELNISFVKPYVMVQAVYEKKAIETMDFVKVVEEDATMLKGEQIVEQEGATGKKEVSYSITEENGVRTARVQTSENVLVQPKDHKVIVGTKVIPSVGTGVFAWPAAGGYISSTMGSRWGRYHYGIDIARPSNYTIKASDNGVVKTAGRHATYGNYIVVNHNNGYETLYAHLSKIDVSVGQVVGQGSALGVMGSTGRSTGTHLHFEIHKNGSEVNPLAYVNQ